MRKFVTIIRRPAGEERAAFQQRFLREIAPHVLQGEPPVLRYVVNLAGQAPANLTRPVADWDVVTETWIARAGDAPKAPGPVPLPPGCLAHVYRVQETIQLDETAGWTNRAPSPGVKSIFFSRRHESLDNATARKYWDEHAPVARAHHAGMARYIQNGVVAPLTEGAPVVHGFAVLHFPTMEDLEQRMFDSEQGQAAIRADSQRLVAGSTVVYATEYVLR